MCFYYRTKYLGIYILVELLGIFLDGCGFCVACSGRKDDALATMSHTDVLTLIGSEMSACDDCHVCLMSRYYLIEVSGNDYPQSYHQKAPVPTGRFHDAQMVWKRPVEHRPTLHRGKPDAP